MAIKVKEKGPYVEQAWKGTWTCHECGSVMEYEDSDVQYRHYPGDQRGEPSKDTFYIDCPLCEFTEDLSGLPKAVKNKIKRRERNK